jgi:hypothetical protein
VWVDQASGQRGERDLGLHAGQRPAETGVDARSEGQVAFVGAVDIEPVGVGEPGRVAVGGRDPGDDVLAAADAVAADVEVAHRYPPGELEWGVVAQCLVHDGGAQSRVGPQRGPLVGVAEEGQGAVADEVDGVFVPGDEQESQGGVDFVGGESFAVVLGGEESGDEVVAGVAATAIDQQGEVVGQLLLDAVGFGLSGPCGVGLSQLGGGLEAPGFERAAQLGAGPRGDDRAVLGGDAEQLGDHRDRQGVGEVGHDLEASVGGGGVEGVVDLALDERAQGFR